MSDTLNRAVQLHRQGQLEQAELLYRQFLDDHPDHPDALHLLGVIAHQRGQPERAVQLMSRAVVLRPDSATFYSNLAEAHRVAGNLSAAVANSQEAIRLQPGLADAHNHLGLALQAQGRLVEAVASFREALRLQPESALVHNNLGSALRELGQTDDALAAIRQAVQLQPALAPAHSNLGQLLLEQGQRDEALAHCREAVRLRPDLAEAWSNLGNVLRAGNSLAEAKDCYLRALQLRPQAALIHGNLGQALQEEGRLDEAIACYRQALEREPRSARVERFLASALVEKEDDREAIRHYRLAVQYQPDYPEAHNGLGRLLQDEGDVAGAISCFREALRLKPDLADAHANLGGALAELGEMDRAVACYREALRCDPEDTEAYSALATHLRDKVADDDAAAMRALLERGDLPDGRRAALHHGLAHVHDARREYAAAAEHARLGNACRRGVWARQGKTYDRGEHSRFATALIERFTPTFFERVRGWGLDTDVPVFVVGLPRSGTTLLEQILASHPQVEGAGELPFTKEAFDSIPTLVGSDQAPAACVPLLTRPVLRQLGETHLDRLRQRHGRAPRVVDKMPDNYLWLGLLAAVFPRARFVYSKRDVRDVAVSCWVTNFRRIRWACDLEDIAARILDHQRVMDHWRGVLPVPLLEIEYEQTVADLEPVARRLVAFCGLEWDPACLAFHETKRTVRTASVSQVRQPIYTGSVQRWKRYEDALAPLWRALARNS